MFQRFCTFNRSLIAVPVVAGSNDPAPTPLRLLLQLPTEEPARVQAGGAPLPQNGVRDSPYVQRGHLQWVMFNFNCKLKGVGMHAAVQTEREALDVL